MNHALSCFFDLPPALVLLTPLASDVFPCCSSAMVNEISIFQPRTLVARLLVKANASWSTPTTVMRFLSEGSTEYCFFVSDAAIESVRNMQPGRIYNVTVPFRTVKANDAGPKK